MVYRPYVFSCGQAICNGMRIQSHIFHKSKTSLHVAVEKGNFLAVQALILNRANAACIDSRGWNALHYAADKGNAILLQFMIKYCENKQVIMEAANSAGATPLDLSTKKQFADCSKLFLDFQAARQQQ